MGNTNKKIEEYDVVRSFRPEQWQNKEIQGGLEVWENSNRNLRSDVYPINREIKQSDLDHYEMRYNTNDDIVKVHHLRIQNEPSLCSKSSSAHLFVERIPYRLPSLTELSQPESLSILRSAYSGFNTISTFYGQVEPYEDMICFNEEGKCKVWISSNLAESEVQRDRQSRDPLRDTQGNEANINKIFDMVENRTVGRSLPDGLKNVFRYKCPKSYFEAVNVLEEYASENRIQIPRTINPRSFENSEKKLEQQSQYQSQTQLKSQQINQDQVISMAPHNFVNHGQPITQFSSQAQLPRQTSQMIRQPHQSVFLGNARSDAQNSNGFRSDGNQGSQYFIRSNGNSMFSIMPNQLTSAQTHFKPNVQGEIRRIHSPNFTPQSIQRDQFYLPMQPQSPTSSLRLNSTPKISPNHSARSSQFIQNEQNHLLQNHLLQNQSVTFQNPQRFHAPAYPLNARQVGNPRPIGQVGGGFAPIHQQGMWGNQVQYFHPLQVHSIQTQNQVHPNNLPNLQLEQTHSEVAPHLQPAQNEEQEKHQTTEENQEIQAKELIGQTLANKQELQIENSEEQSAQVSQNHEQIQEQESREEQDEEIEHRENLLVEREHEFRGARSEENSDKGEEEEEQRSRNEDELNKNEYEEGEQQEEEREQEELEERGEEEEEYYEEQNDNVRNETGIYESTQGPINSIEFGREDNQVRNEVEYAQDMQQSHHFHQEEPNQEAESKIKGISTLEVHLPLSKPSTDRENPSEALSGINSQSEINVVSESEPISHTNIKEDSHEEYDYKYRSIGSKVETNNENKLADDARYEDIEQYIRNKYRNYLNSNPEENNTVDVNYMASYVESKYDQFSNNSNQNTQFSFRPTKQHENKKSQYVRAEHQYVVPHYDQEHSSQTSAKNLPYEYTYNTHSNYLSGRQFGSSQSHNLEGEEFVNDGGTEKGTERGTEKGLEEENDMLDVKYLEKSLDKKYSSLKSNKQIKNITNENNNDEFSVQKLEENLIRFEESKVSQNQQLNFNSNPIFETSQVSKINSIDYRLAQRRSSMKREESEYCDTGRNTNYENRFHNNYENKFSGEAIQKRNSTRAAHITKELSSIDEKFNKYVNKQGSRKTILKPKEQNYDEVYDASSRMATGHFGYAEDKGRAAQPHQDYNDKFFVTSEVRSHKGGISYEELRKFMWS